MSGLVASIKYSPNGDKIYKKGHSVKVTVDDSIEKVKSIKYQWLQTTAEPKADTFVDNYSCNNGGTITKDGLTGSWYLWTLLETENGKTNIGRSEVFYFDNQGPTVTVTPTALTATSFKLTATVTDAHIGQVTECQFYVDGVLKDTVKIQSGKAQYTMTEAVTGDTNCYVIAKDSLENPTKKGVVGKTKLYTWDKYNYTYKDIYVMDITEDVEWGISDTAYYKISSEVPFSETSGIIGNSSSSIYSGQYQRYLGKWLVSAGSRKD